jgi:GH24 family phage-related lysozyme (muramidase)
VAKNAIKKLKKLIVKLRGREMISEKAKKMILGFEMMDQPGLWPAAESGISLGHGYDLGHVTESEFEDDWRFYLSAEQMERLKIAIGIKGLAAKNLAHEFSDITIRVQDADEVFTNKSIPKFEEMTRNAFPGFDNLPADVQGALISLVYNRGPKMNDDPGSDRRKEMRAIRELVETWDGDLNGLKAIADQIRSMKRLWIGKNLGGLLRRRDAEADLIESCMI